MDVSAIIQTDCAGYLPPERNRQRAWSHGCIGHHSHCLGWIVAPRAEPAEGMDVSAIIHTDWAGYLPPEQRYWVIWQSFTSPGLHCCLHSRPSRGHGSTDDRSHCLSWIVASTSDPAESIGLPTIIHTAWIVAARADPAEGMDVSAIIQTDCAGYLHTEQNRQRAWLYRPSFILTGLDTCTQSRHSRGHGANDVSAIIHTAWAGYLTPE